MKLKTEISAGRIADRIIGALQNCEAAEFIRLVKESHLRLSPGDYVVTLSSLKFNSISAYSEATKVSSYYFLYGNEVLRNHYTKQDDLVISFINSLSLQQKEDILKYLRQMYPKNAFDDMKGMRISQKILYLVCLLPYGYLSRIAEEDETVPRYEYLTEEAKYQIQRIRTTRAKTMVFPTDAIPSLASFLGVSLHLLFDLTVPLYCNTQEGDLLFDYFTLLTDEEKQTFYELIIIKKETEMERLSDYISKLRGGF